MHKTEQSAWFFGRIFGLLLKTGFPLIKYVLKPLAKSVLVPLVLTSVASATDTVIRKKMFESGVTTLIISNDENS